MGVLGGRWGIAVGVRILLEFAIGLDLLLHCLFHADGVHHQFKMLEDFGFVAGDVAFDDFVAEQLGQVTLGEHQVQQV